MLFKINTKKHPSLPLAVAVVLFLQYVGSNLAKSHAPPQNQNTIAPSVLPAAHQNKIIYPLPKADHHWKVIRDPNRMYLYIDKTQYLWRMVMNQSACRRFITRSRRFGKSLFLQMTEQFFRGRKDLFRGLFIENYGNKNIFPDQPVSDDKDKWMKYPVIHLNFKKNQKFKTIDQFMSAYYTRIDTIAEEYELQNFKSGYDSTMFLIERLYFKFNRTPVVVLVDEYDYPYEYALSKNNTDLAEEIRDFLDDIFGIMKNDVDKVGFLFIMGVSKLALKVLQSGANNIEDETYNPQYAEAFGFTEEEIMEHLGHYIDEFAKNVSLTSKSITDTLKCWYDGYQFDPNNRSSRVFNPVSTISSLRNKRFECYWIETGSMDPIPEMFYREGWSLNSLLKGTGISPSLIMNGVSALEEPVLIRWMFYNGYYTLNGQVSSSIMLKIPNMEIETAINKTLLSYDPTVQKPYMKFCKSKILMVKVHLESENIREAISILQEIGFPAYSHPLTQKMQSFEVDRRLSMLFEIANIEHKNGLIFKKADGGKDDGGDVDILTQNLCINYAIETKTVTGSTGEFEAIEGMYQLLNKTRYYRNSFMKKLGHPKKIFFMSWAFVIRGGCANLTSWIVLPVNDGEPDLDKFQASSDGVESGFRRFKQQWLMKFPFY